MEELVRIHLPTPASLPKVDVMSPRTLMGIDAIALRVIEGTHTSPMVAKV